MHISDFNKYFDRDKEAPKNKSKNGEKGSKINYEIRFNKAKKEVNYKPKEIDDIESIIVVLFDYIGGEVGM